MIQKLEFEIKHSKARIVYSIKNRFVRTRTQKKKKNLPFSHPATNPPIHPFENHRVPGLPKVYYSARARQRCQTKAAAAQRPYLSFAASNIFN